MKTTPQIEEISAEIHKMYQKEAKRQGDIRHKDKYKDLPENVKDFDRVIAKYIIQNNKRIVKNAKSNHGQVVVYLCGMSLGLISLVKDYDKAYDVTNANAEQIKSIAKQYGVTMEL